MLMIQTKVITNDKGASYECGMTANSFIIFLQVNNSIIFFSAMLRERYTFYSLVTFDVSCRIRQPRGSIIILPPQLRRCYIHSQP